MKTRFTLILLIVVLFASCGEYQQLLKSRDPDLKFQKALEYFNQQQYTKAQTLLDDVSTYYKGTERSEDILAYLGRCYMGQKNYESASEYYEAYIRNYPKGKYIVEARYQVGHGYYLDSPDARLDQEITRKAIEALQTFVELYPESPYAAQAYQEIEEMNHKLAYKEYLNARLYYNLGSYLGNNFESCEITARNALGRYPDNPYQEELNWLILQAKYQQTLMSVEERKLERARDTQDEYYSFVSQFPDSKHTAAAERILKDVKRILK